MRLITLCYPVGAQLDGREGETSAAINLVKKMTSLILTLNPSSDPTQKNLGNPFLWHLQRSKCSSLHMPLHYILAINNLLLTC